MLLAIVIEMGSIFVLTRKETLAHGMEPTIKPHTYMGSLFTESSTRKDVQAT